MVRFERTVPQPLDGGRACRLRFTVVLETHEKAARDAAGWDVCLGELDKVVDGRPTTRPGPQPSARWRAPYEDYERQGLPATAPIPEPADPGS